MILQIRWISNLFAVFDVYFCIFFVVAYHFRWALTNCVYFFSFFLSLCFSLHTAFLRFFCLLFRLTRICCIEKVTGQSEKTS